MMILQFLIEGGLFALCATLFGSSLLRKHPAARYTLLLAALFACLLLPMQMLLFKKSGLAFAHVNLPEDRLKPALQPLVPDGRLKAPPEPMIAVHRLKTAPQPLVPEGRLKPALQPLIPYGNLKPVPQPPVQIYWPFVFICVWVGGALFGLLRFSVGWRRLVGIRQRSAKAEGTLAQEVANDLRAHLGLRKFPEIVLSEEVATPLAFGWRKGAIILPSSLLHSLSKEQLRAAIAHEFAHLDQKHVVSLIVQRVSAALYWPNPLVHLACAELSKAREQVCDNFVLHLAPSTTFARTLLLVAQGQARHRPYPAAAGLLLPEWNLEQRVKGLLDPARRREIHISRLNMNALNVGAVAVCAAAAGIQVGYAQEVSVQVRQGDKVYVLHPSEKNPVIVTVDRRGQRHEFRIGPGGLGNRRVGARGTTKFIAAPGENRVFITAPPGQPGQRIERSELLSPAQAATIPGFPTAPEAPALAPDQPMTPPPADEMLPPNSLTTPMPALPPAALAEIERAYTLLQPGQAPLTIPSINQEELERMLKDRAGDIERIQVEQGLQGIDQEKMQKFFKDHPADQKRLKILMRNQELRGKQFAKAWSKSPKAFSWSQTPKAFTWNQTPKAFSWKEGDKNRSWIQTNPNTAPPTFMFNEGSLAEILGRAKAKALKEGKPDVAEQIQRAIESLGKGE